jgi:hypothetical protein
MMKMTLYRTVHSAVLHDWDPIGVGNIPEAQNEYDAYVPKLCELLESRRARDEIVGYLCWLETSQIGLSGNRQATEAFADKLIQIAATIEEGEQ